MVLIARMQMRFFLTILLVLLFNAAQAETKPAEVKIPWKGDYAHNSSKHWSKDNPYDSGFSKNFKNGTPEEFGDVQKDGELKALAEGRKRSGTVHARAPRL